MGKRVLRRFGVVLGVCAAVLGAVLLFASPAAAQFPGKNGKIAFTSTHDDPRNDDIYTVSADGTGLSRLTSDHAIDFVPYWSPNGAKIAFTSWRDEPNPSYICSYQPAGCNVSVFTMNADGSAQTALTTDAEAEFAGPWLPDGRIAFASFRFSVSSIPGADIYVINADGTARTKLTGTPFGSGVFTGLPFHSVLPAWSPDGKKVAFSNGTEIFVMNADGTGPRMSLTPRETPPAGNPDWSPDGSRILFTYEDEQRCDDDGFCYYSSGLAVANADGSGGFRITNEDGSHHAKWSPDGKKIVFTGADGRLWTMNSDSSGKTPISDFSADNPDWQPLPGPQRSDYRNAAKFCTALRRFLGDAAFRGKFGANGNGANAYGKCVSSS